MTFRKARIFARILLIVALYAFIGLPLTPLWAQEGLLESSAPARATYTMQESNTPWDISARELGDSPLRPRFELNNPSITSLDLIDTGKRLHMAQMEQMPVTVQGQPPLGETLPAEKPKAWYHNREWWVWIVLGVAMVAVIAAGGGGGSGTSTGSLIIDEPIP